MIKEIESIQIKQETYCEKIDKKLILFAVCVAVANEAVIGINILSILVLLCELVLCCYYFTVGKKVELFATIVILYVLGVMETGKYVVFDFRNYRLFGFSIGNIALVLFLVPVLMNAQMLLVKFRLLTRETKKIIKLLLFMLVSSLLMGLVMLLINDNDIIKLENVLLAFVKEFYSYIFTPVAIMLCLLYVMNDKIKTKRILFTIPIACLIGACAQVLVAFTLKKFYHFSNIQLLITSRLTLFTPLLMLAGRYFKGSNKILYCGLPLLCAPILLRYQPSGKYIIMLGAAIIYFAFVFYKNHNVPVVLKVLLTFGILTTLIFLQQATFASLGGALEYEIKQALSMLEFWRDDWLNNVEASPKMRIIEFLTICIEYTRKPLYALFGKGVLGSIPDTFKYFWKYIDNDAFSYEQFANGSFYAMHEALNTCFLYNGFIGVYTWIAVLRLGIRYGHKNYLILIGTIWFVLMFGSDDSTLAVCGSLALLYGLAINGRCTNDNELSKERCIT